MNGTPDCEMTNAAPPQTSGDDTARAARFRTTVDARRRTGLVDGTQAAFVLTPSNLRSLPTAGAGQSS
jgi:hypothetical protein